MEKASSELGAGAQGWVCFMAVTPCCQPQRPAHSQLGSMRTEGAEFSATAAPLAWGSITLQPAHRTAHWTDSPSAVSHGGIPDWVGMDPSQLSSLNCNLPAPSRGCIPSHQPSSPAHSGWMEAPEAVWLHAQGCKGGQRKHQRWFIHSITSRAWSVLRGRAVSCLCAAVYGHCWWGQ